MINQFFVKLAGAFTIAAFVAIGLCLIRVSEVPVAAETKETAGSLMVLASDGKPKSQCPLKRTDVKVEITGFLSRVVVTQDFENPFKEKIEAVYLFPLPQNAAVDDMILLVGERVVRGKILPREEAQAVYDAARAGGQVAGLLDQERPNIFTQSVANILPGEKIKVTISYVETLKYHDGQYQFVFPMVVAPRYMPGARVANPGPGVAPNTTQVPDGSRIGPVPAAPGMRAGHDVSLDISIDAGLAIEDVKSSTHPVIIDRLEPSRARVRLEGEATIPNKDFVLRYDVSGQSLQDAVLTHRTSKGGFFTMILQPPARVNAEDVNPKELIFVLDTSGSMSGFPIEKAKETMKLALDNLYPSDTFNLITFSGDTHILFETPVAATPENLKKAQEFLSSRSGAGGTEMMKAIKAALEPSDSQAHVRIVCFMTDAHVGNDMTIIAEVQKHPNARVFAFGIGNSVNRFLLDKITEYGRGEVEYVGLTDDGSAAAQRFHQRIRNPLLTNIAIDWNGLPVADVYPKRVPDLFSAKPVVLTGRYVSGAVGTLRLRGRMAGTDFVREIPVQFPDNEARHDVLATLWARQRIDDLMAQDYRGAQMAQMRPDLKQTVTQLGLEFRLMTQFTSFVAVEEIIVTDGAQPRRIVVPVEVPEGMNREAIYGQYKVKVPTPTQLNSFYLAEPLNQGVGVITASGRNRRTATGGGSLPQPASTPARPSGTAAETVDVLRVGKPTPAEQRQLTLESKADAMLVALVDRLKKQNPTPHPDESKFVSKGKAELQIWLIAKSQTTIAELKALGFEIAGESKASTLVIGRLPIDKLEALIHLKSVRYVAPMLK